MTDHPSYQEEEYTLWADKEKFLESMDLTEVIVKWMAPHCFPQFIFRLPAAGRFLEYVGEIRYKACLNFTERTVLQILGL